MTTIHNFQKNIDTFYRSCPWTNIMFLYFTNRNDSFGPKVKEVFRRWKINADRKSGGDHDIYLMRGGTGYVYAYQKSSLKLLTYIDRTNPKPYNTMSNGSTLYEYNAHIINSKHDPVNGNAYIGDHITFGVFLDDSQNIVFDTHKTMYKQNTDGWRDHRDYGNFLLSVVNTNSFRETSCTLRPLKLKHVYKDNKVDLLIIKELFSKATGKIVGGFSAIKTYTYNNHIYTVHIGKRGGEYILPANNTKKYISNRPKGGAPFLEYKSINFMTEAFTKFLYNHIIKKVFELRPRCEGVQVIYDAYGELNDNGPDNIVFIYEFEMGNMIDIFFIDTKTALAACYANQVLTNNDANKAVLDDYETQAYNTIINMQLADSNRPIIVVS